VYVPDNDLLALIQAGLTPQQVAGLQGIANLRAAGFTDPEIFAMPSAAVQGYATGTAPLRIGAGAAYLPTAADLARTSADYRLGRGTLAQRAAEFAHQRAMDEAQLARFNFVQYLDYLARTGGTIPLGAKVIQRLQPVQVTRAPNPAEQYVEDFLTYPREEPGDLQLLRKQRQELGDERFLRGMQALAALDKPQGFRHGGTFDTDEPIIGIGAYSRRPRMVFGEAGRERVTITPVNLGKSGRRSDPRYFALGGAAFTGKKGGLGNLGEQLASFKAKRGTPAQRLGRARQAERDAEGFARAAATPGGQYTDKETNISYSVTGNRTPRTPEQYRQSGKKRSEQIRYGADPLTYRRSGGELTGARGGQYLTPEERAARISRFQARQGTPAAQLGQRSIRRPSPVSLGGAPGPSTTTATNQPRESLPQLGQRSIRRPSPVSLGGAPGPSTTTATNQPRETLRQTSQPAPSSQGVGPDAQNAAEKARFLGQALRGSVGPYVTSEFVESLLRGEVPGISQITKAGYRGLNPELRKALVDLWLDTGQAMDEASIDETFERYTPAGA
jgi:hypothetical protein